MGKGRERREALGDSYNLILIELRNESSLVDIINRSASSSHSNPTKFVTQSDVLQHHYAEVVDIVCICNKCYTSIMLYIFSYLLPTYLPT
jgi:hypothetical protein